MSSVTPPSRAVTPPPPPSASSTSNTVSGRSLTPSTTKAAHPEETELGEGETSRREAREGSGTPAGAYSVQPNGMDANPHLLDLQTQLRELAERLGEKLDRSGRSGGGGKEQKLQASRRVGGVTLPPIEKSIVSSGLGKSNASVTGPSPSAGGGGAMLSMMRGSQGGARIPHGTLLSSTNTSSMLKSSETMRRERMIKKGIFEAHDIMTTAERVSLTTSSPTKLDMHERQYGDALAALQFANTNGELNNAVRAKEMELAQFELERDAIQRGYLIASRKYEAMKQRQEELASLTDGHAAEMVELRRREKDTDKRLRAKEQEVAANHRLIEDLSVQLQKVNQKLPKSEIDVLTQLWELKEAHRALATLEEEFAEESEKDLASRKRNIEHVTQQVAIFDAEAFVKQYWSDLESRSNAASPLLLSQILEDEEQQQKKEHEREQTQKHHVQEEQQQQHWNSIVESSRTTHTATTTVVPHKNEKMHMSLSEVGSLSPANIPTSSLSEKELAKPVAKKPEGKHPSKAPPKKAAVVEKKKKDEEKPKPALSKSAAKKM